ncbi:hypothetical protein AWENTII_008855 [Aspergillus wentii]
MEKSSRIRPRRAARACTFCQRRKLRCDNKQPSCSNCTGYAKECVYASGTSRPRSTKARVSHLEEENQELRQRLEEIDRNDARSESTGDVRPVSPELPRLSMSTLDAPTDDTRQANAHSAVSRILISPNGDSSYHGLTSTLFEDARTDNQTVPSESQIPVDHIRKQLMGEAAYQHQLETLNLQQGKLDFDGVDPDLGMHLLSLHWNRQHHSFLITYRPAFMRDMACNGPYFSKLLLNAIYFGAAKFSNRPEVRRDPDDVRTAGWRYRMRVRELLGGALDRSEITTIQALLVMTSSMFALGDERSAAWLYAGTAFRMIIDLGMHVDPTMLANMRHLSQEDVEIRRRVFWGAFIVDKIQSLYQGRPASLQDFDVQVSLTFLDQYEELEHWQPFAYSTVMPYPGSPAYSVSTFKELCKLSVILNGVLNKVYSERSSTHSRKDLIANLTSLDTQLKQWHAALPPHLRFHPGQTTPPPHILSLLALYNVLLILLHRPFVAEGHLHTTDPSVAVTSFTTCTTAAANIIQLLRAYDTSFSIRRAPYLISYATYVAATIYVRVAAQQEGGSRAHVNLRTCIAIFHKNQETNWAVRRAEKVILHLMERMGVNMDVDEHGSQERALPEDTFERDTHQARRTSPYMENMNVQMAPETEALDLDMNMIIQSFIRQQGNNPGEYMDVPMPAPVPVGAFPYTELLDDDMLFGFNGSLQDTLLN